MAKLRVLVVEDSPTIRARFVAIFASDPGFEVVGVTDNGKEAFDLCAQLRPDVVTLDMMLPVMTGLAATEQIMAHCPTPILIVSASINRGELFRTYEALAAGAVDVLEKPRGDEPEGAWERQFLQTVKLVSRIKVMTHIRAKLGAMGRASVPAPTPAAARAATTPIEAPPNAGDDRSVARGERQAPRVIGIGVSTGGPSAILEILRGLPASFPLPILLVIHIGDPFGVAFAEWLDEQSPIRVGHAQDGEPLPPPGRARVYMAPASRHLVVRNGHLALTNDAERHSCRPSVDVLFESMARECGDQAAGCLLTGMGRDGAEGLLAMRRAGGTTIAQDEASSVVFGMPREAIILGAAQRVLPLDRIARELVKLAAATPRRHAP